MVASAPVQPESVPPTRPVAAPAADTLAALVPLPTQPRAIAELPNRPAAKSVAVDVSDPAARSPRTEHVSLATRSRSASFTETAPTANVASIPAQDDGSDDSAGPTTPTVAEGPAAPQPAPTALTTEVVPTVAAPVLSASAPVAAPAETIANLSTQIAQGAEGKTSRFDVQLTPDGLGRVDVAVEIDAAGKVTATLSFEKADAASLAKTRSGELRSSLADLGLTMSSDALRIEHSPAPITFAASDPSQSASLVSTPQHASNDPGAPSQTPAQHAMGGGETSQQGRGQQQHQGERPTAPAFGGLRSFELAAGAADAVDQRQAYASRLSARGLDIRI